MAEKKPKTRNLEIVRKPNVPGQKPRYTSQLAKTICKRIAEGETLAEICTEEGMPHRTTVYGWRLRYPQFAELYNEAIQCRAECWADQIIETANSAKACKDHVEIMGLRLKVDTLKWACTRFHPRRFSDAKFILQTELSTQTITLEDLLHESHLLEERKEE